MNDSGNPVRRKGGPGAIRQLPHVSLDEAAAVAYPSAGGRALEPAPKMRVTRIGLEGFAQNFEEWAAFGQFLREVEAGLQWAIGDWLNQGEIRYRDTYMGAAVGLGFEVATLRDFAYVARSVKLSVRTDALSFNHHKLIAAMDPQMQRLWLARAVAANWSIGEMRDQLRGDKAAKSWYVKTWQPTYNRLDRVLNSAPASELATIVEQVEEWLRAVKARLESGPK
ncbi:MAG: hypothetical protein IPM16_06860 [Chloroflexi bacterium]|nr:hypothetical protein [Chloroflexota bacterium]